ncbi:MAG: DUF1349 domain-containing protein, partial [Phycisphaerales bacterium]|nr:DUF1349 domain-containing protein [Phycisphaerales bacterium]
MTRSNHRLQVHPLNIKKAKALGHVSHWFDALEPRKMLSGQGLLAQYFDNPDLTGTAVHHDVHAVVDEDWGMGSPANALHADAFSVRWTGKVEAQYSQAYTFTVTAQGGVRLWVNNQQIIDQWTAEGSGSFSGNISLTANQKYDIRLEYRETAGDAGVALLWSSPSQTQQIIPLARLSHWLQTQIGSGVTGSMSYNSGTGVYTIQGSGSNLGESSNTHFTYQNISGDAEIVARLVSKSNDWSSVGLMIRDGLGTGAQSYVLVLSDNGKVFGISNATTGKSIDISQERYAPVWMRVVRKGDTLTGYVSQDGNTWVALWGRNINMSEAVQVGFAVSSHSTTSLVTATFDNVRISSPQWDHDTSWLGNTFNGAGQWVQNDIKGFYVASDGTIFTNSPWDEGGSEAGVYKDQQNLGRLANLHGWGRSGGWAVTADSNYVYALVGQDYLGWDATGYPSSGQYWNVIARYHRST